MHKIIASPRFTKRYLIKLTNTVHWAAPRCTQAWHPEVSLTKVSLTNYCNSRTSAVNINSNR